MGLQLFVISFSAVLMVTLVNRFGVARYSEWPP